MEFLTALRRLTAAAYVLVAVTGPSGAQQTLEPDVKAAFLYNFTRYVEWPPEMSPLSEPFRLCVVAEAVLRGAIQLTVAGESVNGRPLVMTEPHTPQDARTCQILFVGRSESQRASHLLEAVRDQPVLTVSDASQFAQQGGIIEFLLQDNRVRFDVNLSSAQRSQLRISSQLLRVANKVLGAPK
ncbi:hypothetical protein BH24ACI5_BH24ACI5_28240 [soil metagenome]